MGSASADAQDVGRSSEAAGAEGSAVPGRRLEHVLPHPAPQPGDLDGARDLHLRSRRRADDRAAAAGGTSVGVRLTRALGLVVALLLLVGASGAGGLLVTGSSRTRETQLRGLEAANATLQLTLADADAAVRDATTGHLPQSRQTYDHAVQALPALRARVQSLLTDPLQRSLFAEQSALIDAWLRTTDPDRGAADLTGAAAQAAAFTDLRDANTRLDDLVRRQRHDATSTEAWVRYGALAVTALTLAAALAVVAGTGARTRRALVDPLRSLVDVLDAHGRGDRRAHADPTAGPAEVRSVALAVNDLARENARLLEAAEQSARLHRLAGDIGRQVRDQLVAEDALQVAVTRLGRSCASAASGCGCCRTGPDPTAPAACAPGWARWPGSGPPPRWPRCARCPAATGAPRAPSTTPAAGCTSCTPPGRSTPSPTPAACVAAPPARRVPARHRRPRPAAGPHRRRRLPAGSADRRVRDGTAGLDRPRGRAGPLRGGGPVPRPRPGRPLPRPGTAAGGAARRRVGQVRPAGHRLARAAHPADQHLRLPRTPARRGRREVGEDVAAVLGIVERNTDRLRALIEDLLLLSRVESAPTTEVRGASTVADLLSGVLAAVAAGPTSGGTVRCTTAPDELTGLRVPGRPSTCTAPCWPSSTTR